MRIGWPSRGMICPALGPSVTVRVRGAPRGCFLGLGCLAGRGCLATLGASTRVPKMSDRMTDTADSTKIHKTAKNPNLISVSVSSDTRSPRSLGVGVSDNHGRVSDDDRGAVVQQRLLDAPSVHAGAVGGAKVDGAHRNLTTAHVNSDLHMPAGYARVVDPEIGLIAPPDDDARRLQRMALPLDLEHHWRRLAPPTLTCDGGDFGIGATAYAKAPGRQALGPPERDVQPSGEGVALLLNMFANQSRELGRQRVAVRREPIEVGGRELDMKAVGRKEAVARQNLDGVVDLALQRGSDLYWLHSTAEGPGECSRDHLLEPLFEAVEHTHDLPPFPCLRSYRARSNLSGLR